MERVGLQGAAEAGKRTRDQCPPRMPRPPGLLPWGSQLQSPTGPYLPAGPYNKCPRAKRKNCWPRRAGGYDLSLPESSRAFGLIQDSLGLAERY